MMYRDRLDVSITRAVHIFATRLGAEQGVQDGIQAGAGGAQRVPGHGARGHAILRGVL